MNCCDYDCTQGRDCPARQKPTPGAPNAWEPSGKDHDRSIHSNPDAKAWADLFVDTFPGLADKRDLMLGWFANAMMAMHDSIKQKQAPPAAVPTNVRERWNIERDGDALRVCFNDHEKGEACEYVRYVPEAPYAELLYAVESKWPGESRHETALRYIREREAGTASIAALAADKETGND